MSRLASNVWQVRPLCSNVACQLLHTDVNKPACAHKYVFGTVYEVLAWLPCALTMTSTSFKLTSYSCMCYHVYKVRAFSVGVRQPEGSGGAAHVAAAVAPTADSPGNGEGRVRGIWL